MLPAYTERLSEQARQQLVQLGAEVRTNALVTNIAEGCVCIGDEASSSIPAVVPNAVLSLELRDLERAIASLSEEQRQVILLVGLEGMRYEKVASVLDIPIGTVRSRLSRGRHALRKMMEGSHRTAAREQYRSEFDRRAA